MTTANYFYQNGSVEVGTRNTADFCQKRIMTSSTGIVATKTLKYALASPLDMFFGVIFLAFNFVEMCRTAVNKYSSAQFFYKNNRVSQYVFVGPFYTHSHPATISG